MYKFFVDENNIDTEGHTAYIDGPDFNHIKNVLRMKQGEEISLSDGKTDREYRCIIDSFAQDRVICKLCFIKQSDAELPSKIYLFQGLPKQDKMELVIQKAVELGAFEIIPVACHRSVVKLDEKKSAAKVGRWNTISEAAAKQSKRGVIPAVTEVKSFEAALRYASENQIKMLVPYELASSDREAMDRTRDIIENLSPGEAIGVFIGPEGGFEDREIQMLREVNGITITLGRRILRTETAGMTVLSWLVFILEGREQ